MQKLREAIKQSGLSNAELSVKLGHSKKYLTNVLLTGVSTAKQEELIESINQIKAGTFKTDVEVIAELSSKLAEVQDKWSDLDNKFCAVFSEQEERIDSLRDACDSLGKNLTKEKNLSEKNRNAAIIQSELADKIAMELNKTLESKKSLLSANTELNAELNTMRKNAQEADEALKLVKDDLDYIKLENDKLRETVENQNDLNAALNEENAKLAEKLGFAKKEIHNLKLENKTLKRTNKINSFLAFLCLLVIIILTCIKWSV